MLQVVQRVGVFQDNLQRQFYGMVTAPQKLNRAIDKHLKESNNRSVKLPESAQTIDVLLDEMYGVYNSTTGSLFTGFALRSEMEKERLLNDLLDLFIAADKVRFQSRLRSNLALD
jgi:histone acetyltransferase HTATIP